MSPIAKRYMLKELKANIIEIQSGTEALVASTNENILRKMNRAKMRE